MFSILIYCSIGIALFYLQEKFLLHPQVLPPDYSYTFDVPFREASIAMNDSDTLNMVQFLPKATEAVGVVLYFHGNRDNINRYAKFAANFTKHGYEVWMPDYPGYGKSTGTFTEDLVYAEARQVYKLALSRFSADSIIIYGKSLGTGPASFLSSKFKSRELILETPYYSMGSLFGLYAPIYPTSRMAKYKFPVGKYVQESLAPVTIFHGTSDKVVFYRNAKKLKKVMSPRDRFFTIQGGGHNNLNDYPLFHEKLDSLLR